MKLKMMGAFLAVTVLILMSGIVAYSDTAFQSISVNANVGDPSWATFVFGHGVDGEPGVTELIVQCDQNRAELITNFDVYGQQLVSNFFTINCTKNISYSNGVRVFSFSVNGVPLSESLVMTGRDSYGNYVTQNLNLQVLSANWTVKGSGRWQTDSGNAEISY